jgi:hypothetical protein
MTNDEGMTNDPRSVNDDSLSEEASKNLTIQRSEAKLVPIRVHSEGG